MPLRVIELVTPRKDEEPIRESLKKHHPDEDYIFWVSPLEDEDMLCIRIVLDVQESENVIDMLDNEISFGEQYRIVVYPAQATLPRLDPEDENGEAEKKGRISREELYSDVLDTSLTTPSYLLLILFSSIVAVIGLMRDNVAVIIGSMVLAPLLGPNVGLALATTLADIKLALRASMTLTTGVIIAFIIALSVGYFFGAPMESQQLLDRCETRYSDIALALASGGAGILAFTMGVPSSVVGVMVALALLPPLASAGLLVGADQFEEAGGAILLFFTNVICLNLAGVGMFLVQGVKPQRRREKERALTLVLRMGALWVALLILLSVIIHYAQPAVPNAWPESFLPF
ncbi:MAG: TIGR00341 family protein [Desulfovibrio sp.]|nr:TIGR00341 family protein [Desulfovibrio sp.]|tara:strand:+ start:4008 stop:5042 length:1035 start_codon:yes stop_codon:yes gene_type:complete